MPGVTDQYVTINGSSTPVGVNNGTTKNGSTRKKGGRKKNLRPPSPTVLKQRREAANARERKRMNGLNDAFERLREVSVYLFPVPHYFSCTVIYFILKAYISEIHP